MSGRERSTAAAPPATAAVRHRRIAIGFWLMVLIAAVVVSAVGNVVHAETVAPAAWVGTARWIAGALPVALLLMVEGITFSDRGGASGTARWAALALLIPLLLIVLGGSYLGLLTVVAETELYRDDNGFRAAVGYGLAAVPDLLMVAATIYLMSFRRSPTDSVPVPGRWGKIVANLGDRAVAASAAKPATAPSPPLVDPPAPASSPTVSTVVERAAVGPHTPVSEPAVTTPAPVPATADAAPAPAPTDLPEPTDADRATASRIIDAGVTILSPATVAQVLAAVSAGVSQRKVADAVEIDRKTVGKVVAAAGQFPSGVRALTAVGGDRM